MEARVRELEAQVQQLTEQRDELYRDIEGLCLANGDGSCTESSLLMQRVVDAERQRDDLAAENEMLKAEKASLLEDMASIRQSKQQSDAFCRELAARFEEVSRGNLSFAKEGSQTECERSEEFNGSNLGEDPKEDSFTRDNAELWEGESVEEGEKDSEEEGVLPGRTSGTTAQLKGTGEPMDVLQERIRFLEESLEKRDEELEKAQEDVRRSEHHVSVLLEQLEKVQSGEDGAKSAKPSRKSRSLRKKLDRLSVDLTKAFSKMRSKEDALSETEAEMDCMKRRHSADMTLVRQAYDIKLEETKQVLEEKDETIQAQQRNLQIMELEKRKLASQIARRDVALSRLKDELRNNDNRAAAQSASDERDQELLESKRKIDGMESRIKMLERKLHHCNLRKEAAEQQKNQALVKASAYKKKYLVLKLRSKAEEEGQENGLPLLESNLHLHNFAIQWEDAIRKSGGARSIEGSQSGHRRARSRTGSVASRYSNVSLAQFALFALMVKGMENHSQQQQQ